MFKQIILLFALISTCFSASGWGGCPDTFRPGVEFNTTDYLGKWYEIARHNTIPFQKGDCGTATYSFKDENSIGVLNKEKTPEKNVEIVGTATKTKDPFRFSLRFGDSILSKVFTGDYRVASTDYKNFAIVYSCFDYFFGRFYYAWILSRTPVMPDELLQKALKELDTVYGIKKAEMRFNNHTKELCGDH
jgi:apolipoprotein D and lipocalin family protein